MSYLSTWHKDHAAEALIGFERSENKYGTGDMARAHLHFAKYVITCGQGAQLARDVGVEAGDAKTVSIADTVLATIAANSKYKKITDKQQYALGVALLEKFGNARAIDAAIWGLTDAEIEAA